MRNRPNILILLTDQQRHDTIAAAGFPHMITPHLDRLVSMSTLYTHAHSSNPVCMPARHDLLTGLPGKAHGYFSNSDKSIKDPDLPTLAGLFSAAGYRTAAIGKCHFEPPREHHGYDELILMEELPVRREDDEYAMWLKEKGLGHLQNIHGVRPHIYHIPQCAQMDLEHHGSTWVADRAIDWLHQNGDEPFLLTCGWIHPHPPWDIPEEYRGRYRERDLPEAIPPGRAWPEPENHGAWFGDDDTPARKRAIREAYYDSITCVDDAIGRVLNFLEEENLLEDTMIIFLSDHGEMLQDKGYYSKELPYEGSVRIPLVVKYPGGHGAGEVRHDFVDLLDILPTCLDVAGLTYPAGGYTLPGSSIVRPRGRKVQIASTFGAPHSRWVMARTERYKYIYTYNGGREQLYDLLHDPEEMHPIHNPEVCAELRAEVLAWERAWGPDWAVQDDALSVHPAREHHPSQCGKFHLWSNMQTQAFDERPPRERAGALAREMGHALSDAGYSGVMPWNVFNDTEWLDQLFEQARR
ncbi:MAG: sulfatase [Kiritimatiellia bacterium]